MIITYLITRCHLDNPVKLVFFARVFHRDIQTLEIKTMYENTRASRSCFHTLFSRVWITR
jgi:hypothetical protein